MDSVTSTVISATDDTFADDVLGSSLPVLVEFTAAWCKPGTLSEAHLEDLAAANEDRLAVVSVDIDHNPQTVAAYNVKAVPTFLVVQDGKVVASAGGAPPRAQLLTMLAPHVRGVHFGQSAAELLAKRRAAEPRNFARASVSDNLVPVTDDTFEAEVLQSDVPVLALYWVDWSFKSHAVLPLIDILASTYLKRLKVVTIDLDANPVATETYGAEALPVAVVFQDGQVVEYMADVYPEDGRALAKCIESHVPAEKPRWQLAEGLSNTA